MKVKFTEDNELRKLPTRATEGSAAYDLYMPKDTVVKRGRNIIPLGFCIELNPQTAAEVHPRSGHSSKGMEGYDAIIDRFQSIPTNRDYSPASDGIWVACDKTRFDCDVIYGLIDEDYRGECGVIVNNHDSEFLLKKGDRIAQMLIVPVVDVSMEIVDELSPSDRKGGFGWSNDK